MYLSRVGSRAVRLAMIAVLCASVVSFDTPQGMAAEELQREIVPGLDLWTQEREAAPYWDMKRTTPDLLSRARRHREFMQAGVPLEYRSRRNPYPAATTVIQDGGKLYTSHCATCHGAEGAGDGKAGLDLSPSPAFLAYMIDRPRSVDEYLLWSISEGGAPFGTEMPAFKATLTEAQIWQIVRFMRAGFPELAEIPQN